MATSILRMGLITVMAMMCDIVPQAAAASDFSGWSYKMKVVFCGYTPPVPDEVLSNFPALVILNTNIEGFVYENFSSGRGGDLRFADSNETLALKYEVERWDTNGNSYVWVQVPELRSSNTYIWAYWHNADSNPPVYTTNGGMWSAEYAGVWHLKENGFPYADSTAGKRDGTSGATPSYTNAGMIGGGQVFDGATQKIDIPFTNALNTGTFTFSCWANVSGGTGAYRSPITSRDDAPQRGYVLYADNVNKWSTYLGNGSAWTTVTATNVTTGTWVHLAGTYDGANMRLFVNGASAGAVATSLSLNTARPFRIGAGATDGAGNYWFNGTIDEVRYENVPRSSNWIWTCWMNQGSNAMFNSFGTVIPQGWGTVMVIK